MQFAKRLAKVGGSATLAITARAQAMKKQGIDVLSFGAGEPDFKTPEHIRRAAAAAIEKGYTRYTPSAGLPELRQAIAADAAQRYGLAVTPEQVVVSVGAKHAIMNSILATCQEGDEVIIPAPYWVSYPAMAALAEATPVIIDTPAEKRFLLDPGQLRRALTPRTRMVILNSPSNPTGAVYDEALLRALGEVLRASGCWILCDDIYNRMVYGTTAWRQFAAVNPDLYARTIIINGVSKTYAMTGWRIGWAISARELAVETTKIQDQSTSNPCTISQHATLAALTGEQQCVDDMVAAFDRRRKLIVDGLNRLPGVKCLVPDGAFYAFPGIADWLGKTLRGRVLHTDVEVAEALLEHFHVALVPGAAFGGPGYLRLSYATDEQTISRGLERLAAFAKELS